MDQDQKASTYTSIAGGQELLDWFGGVPSFHDAEIIDLHLKRQGRSTLRLHAWNTTDKLRNGYYVLERHAVVEFSMGGITELDLNDFNHQNVIFRLALSRVDTGDDSPVFELLLEPCYGLAGLIRAKEISVSFSPGKPAQSL